MNKSKELSLSYAMHLLKEDSIKAFTDDFQRRLSQYGNDAAFDAYMEALIERNCLDNISKMLLHWSKYLEALPDSPEIRGANITLLTLSDLCLAVDKMNPEEGI